jgi:hypothetical protein
MATKATPLVQVPRGGPGLPLKSASMSLQIAPDYNFGTDHHNVGKGEGFGRLASQLLPPSSSPQDGSQQHGHPQLDAIAQVIIY